MAKARPAAFGALLALALAGPSFAANDFRDVAIVSATINMVLEGERSGVKVNWSNPETGNGGYVVAERTFFLDPQSPCRDYRRSMRNAAGETMVVTGTGCRTRDGRWELDEEAKAQPAGAIASTGATRSPGPARPSIGGLPGTDPRPEPPTPITGRRSGPTRSATRPAEVGEPEETRPVARTTEPASRVPAPATDTTTRTAPLPEPVVRAPEPLTPPVVETEPESAPRQATTTVIPAPETAPKPKAAARTEPSPPPSKATSTAEPRVSVSLPRKSEG